MSTPLLSAAEVARLKISFEFFPPRSPDMEGQLWETVTDLGRWNPDFVSVTYGAGGSTREPTLTTVRRLIADVLTRQLPQVQVLACASIAEAQAVLAHATVPVLVVR